MVGQFKSFNTVPNGLESKYELEREFAREGPAREVKIKNHQSGLHSLGSASIFLIMFRSCNYYCIYRCLETRGSHVFPIQLNNSSLNVPGAVPKLSQLQETPESCSPFQMPGAAERFAVTSKLPVHIRPRAKEKADIYAFSLIMPPPQ